MTITSAPGPAGCGCTAGQTTGGGASGCGCACGQGGTSCCGSCQKQGTPRPRFFAGQLLTEDDLEALTAYVTAKSRLHTRYLAGSGVVCGLEVTCHPCGGGTLRVQPGYALDCCGRDIVVACPTDLDVNAMIRDLRLSQLGTDCGDPCPPATTTQTGTTTEAGTITQTQDKEQEHEPARHYCLYVRYEEQLTDPVAPYITEEPCGQPACEPTRVYEGYQFLLRCQSHRASSGTIADALRTCLHHPRITRLSGDLTKYATPLREAARPTEPLRFDSKALAGATRDLAKAYAPGTKLTPEQTRTVASGIEEVAAQLVRLQLQDDTTREQSIRDSEQIIDTARTGLGSAAPVLADPPEGTWPDPLERQAAQALFTQAQQLADDQAGPLDPIEARMLAQRAPFDREVWSVLTGYAVELRDWLLSRLDDAPLVADGELRAAAERIRIPDGGAGKTISHEVAEAAARLASTLSELLARYQRNCVCAAVNPPCPTCDDSDVLLACLEVRDCAVVRICSTVRDWVISGPALSYWIPQLAELHKMLEAYCCGASPRLAESAAEGLLPAPLAAALGTPDDPPVADQLTTLRAEVGQIARQVATMRGALSTEKGRITNLYAARQRRP